MSLTPASMSFGFFRLVCSHNEVKRARKKKDSLIFQTIVENQWAEDPEDCLDQLQNGDHIVIFAENAYDQTRAQRDYALLIREQQETIQEDLFGDYDVMTLYNQNWLKNDPRDFLEAAGFAKMPEVKPDWHNAENAVAVEEFFNGRPTLPFLPLHDYDEVKQNKLVPRAYVLPFENTKKPQRPDVIYTGIVDRDNRQHKVRFKLEDGGYEMFKFHGLQKGFTEKEWGAILRRGHQTLLMRPEYGIA